MEKYNSKKAIEELTKIYSANMPTKAEYKQAVLSNLPKPKAPNEAVQDFNEFIGLKEKHPAEKYQDRIESSVARHTKSKEESMCDFAIKRDAAMFTTADMAANPKLNYEFEAIIQLHEKWLAYFKEIYGY